MKIIADLHTHTNACTHAYSSLSEMVETAAAKGLYAIGITEHGISMQGSPDELYFRNLKVIPKEMMGVRVLKGMEANIIDFNGRLDASESLLKTLEWVVASFHSITILDKPSIEKCTNAYLSICDNPYVHVIGHSGSPAYEYDFETVIKRCAQTSTLVEINDTTFTGFRKNAVPNCIKIASLCKKHGARIVVDSDAHFYEKVGDLPHAIAMLKEIDFPPELIVNSSVKNLQDYFIEKNIEI
ncbi:MAG: phosphatase [Eubacteriales bacterium]|nr:phosphatase [Eubacteriales bacterium]